MIVVFGPLRLRSGLWPGNAPVTPLLAEFPAWKKNAVSCYGIPEAQARLPNKSQKGIHPELRSIDPLSSLIDPSCWYPKPLPPKPECSFSFLLASPTLGLPAT